MRILRLQKKIKNVVISFDDGSSVKIRYDVAVKSGLRKGDDLNEEKLTLLLNENTKYLMKESALRYLSNRAHSIFELRTKLRRKYPESQEFIEETLNYLRTLDLLNDKTFAQNFAELKFRVNKIGPVKLRAELIRKGVKHEIVDEVVNKFYIEKDFTSVALVLAKKKLSQIENLNLSEEKIKNRIFGFLKNRGFTNDLIYRVFRELEL